MDLSHPTQPCFVLNQDSLHSLDLLSQVLNKQSGVNSFDYANCTTMRAEMQNSSSPAMNNTSSGVPDECALVVAEVLGLGKKKKGVIKKKRKSSSQAPPIRILTADASNFRQIVHHLTGLPQAQSMDRETYILSGPARTTTHFPPSPSSPLNHTLPAPHLLPFLPFNHIPPASFLDPYINSLEKRNITPPISPPPPPPPPIVESMLDFTPTPSTFATWNTEFLPSTLFVSSLQED